MLRRWRYPLSASISAAGSLRTPLLGTAVRSTGRAPSTGRTALLQGARRSVRPEAHPELARGERDGILSRRGQEGPFSEVSVDVLERQAAGKHENLHPVEELADLLRRPLTGLV